MSSRELYQVTGQDVQALLISLNFAMARIADRLDKIEGVRGTSTIASDLDLQNNNIINVGNFDQNLGTADAPQFGGLTIDGDLAVTGEIRISDSNGEIIHQFKVGT